MDLKTFLFGLAVTTISGAIVLFYDKIARHLAGGISDQGTIKKWGMIGIGVGILIMFNIMPIILKAILGGVFPGLNK